MISYLSIVAAGLAGICFWKAAEWPWLLMAGPVLCFLRLWFNMLDGMVALASGKASLRGEILNDLPDRISDVLIFVGVAHSGLCAPPNGYWAAIMALLTAYIGMFGQAVGGRREFGGVMSKPWRMVTLSIGAAATLAMLWLHHDIHWGPLTVLDWTCVIVIVGCMQTMVVRLRRIFRDLAAKKTG